MKCPKCEEQLKEIPFLGVKVDSCSSCKGYWFEKDELRKAKDKKEETLNWMDVDLWESEEKFRISKNEMFCPDCGLPLYEVNYGDSNIKVDVCNMCEGMWLDEGEFKKVMKYLKEKGGDKIMHEYFKTLLEETGEVLLGPESLEEEVKDLLTVLSLLKYRFAGKHPFISRTISNLPKS
jgi:Zn-finger nucleic acid-binding protein